MSLDIEGVLADLIADDPMWIGDNGQPLDYLPEREGRIAEFVYSVAAVLREQIAAWLADFPWTETARDDLLAALAAQVAPSRVPGEGS